MLIPEILRIQSQHRPGSLASILGVIAAHGLTVEGLRATYRDHEYSTWEITVEVRDGEQVEQLLEEIDALPNAHVLGRSDRVFERHRGGKIRTVSRKEISSLERLRDLYTPGVARVCLAIQDDPSLVGTYTNIRNTVAIVTNGTAVLGLGDIGPQASLPVMEGKAALFAQLAGISGVPILLQEKDPGRMIDIVTSISPSFGAIQLEDIAAPACFELESALKKKLNIPVMHDDQHGTAVVVLAALLGAARKVGKDLADCTVGQIGLGAAGLGICGLLMKHGVKHLVGADLNEDACARLKAMGGEIRPLQELVESVDVVIATTGVKGLIQPAWIRTGQIVLALSNPEPEIEPSMARTAGASFATDGKVVNNVLGFPGIFRGALDAGARDITDEMLLAAAHALSRLGSEDGLVPDPLDKSVHTEVARAVAAAAAEVSSA